MALPIPPNATISRIYRDGPSKPADAWDEASDEEVLTEEVLPEESPGLAAFIRIKRQKIFSNNTFDVVGLPYLTLEAGKVSLRAGDKIDYRLIGSHDIHTIVVKTAEETPAVDAFPMLRVIGEPQ